MAWRQGWIGAEQLERLACPQKERLWRRPVAAAAGTGRHHTEADRGRRRQGLEM